MCFSYMLRGPTFVLHESDRLVLRGFDWFGLGSIPRTRIKSTQASVFGEDVFLKLKKKKKKKKISFNQSSSSRV